MTTTTHEPREKRDVMGIRAFRTFTSDLRTARHKVGDARKYMGMNEHVEADVALYDALFVLSKTEETDQVRAKAPLPMALRYGSAKKKREAKAIASTKKDIYLLRGYEPSLPVPLSMPNATLFHTEEWVLASEKTVVIKGAVRTPTSSV